MSFEDGIVQVHWQSNIWPKDESPCETRLVSTRKFSQEEAQHGEIQKWCAEVLRNDQDNRPEGWIPLMCDSSSIYYIKDQLREQENVGS